MTNAKQLCLSRQHGLSMPLPPAPKPAFLGVLFSVYQVSKVLVQIQHRLETPPWNEKT